jgi:hypothetical protein
MIKKNCGDCIYAQENKCPIVCQLSPFCPKEAAKPLLKPIKRNAEEYGKIRTYFEN